MALGAVRIPINTTSQIYQPFSAGFLSIVTQGGVTSLISVQMTVVLVTVKVGKFFDAIFSIILSQLAQPHSTHMTHAEKHIVQQYTFNFQVRHLLLYSVVNGIYIIAQSNTTF
jgi:hypothetical protein